MADLSFPYILVTSSLKKIATMSFVGLTASASAVTITLSTTIDYSGVWKKVTDSITSETQKLYNDIKDRAETGYKHVAEQYTGTYQEISKNATEDVNKVRKEWNKGEQTVGEIKSYLNKENLESYNFYVFTNRKIINSIIHFIPVIIRDSIKEATEDDGEVYELLTFKKISHILNNPKTKELIKKISELGKIKHAILDKLTDEDGYGIMEVIRSLPFEESGSQKEKTSPRIEKFITDTTKHIDDIIKDETRTYATAKDLIIDVLMGKDAQEEIKTNVAKVLQQLQDKSEEILENVGVTSGNLNLATLDLQKVKALLESLEKAGKANGGEGSVSETNSNTTVEKN